MKSPRELRKINLYGIVLFCFVFKGTLMIDCSVKSIDTFWGKQMKKRTTYLKIIIIIIWAINLKSRDL